MFSVTKYSCATGYFSFGHELGHNMGAHHDRGTTNTCGDSDFRYGYRDPAGQYRSILAYSCATGQCDNNPGGSCTRSQFFSHPDPTGWNGKPAGYSVGDPLGETNNAKRINDSASVIAGFYDDPTNPPPTQSPTTAAPTPFPTPEPTAAPVTNPPTTPPTNPPPTQSPTTAAPTVPYDCTKHTNGRDCPAGTCLWTGKNWKDSSGSCVAANGGPGPSPTPPPTPPTGGCPYCSAIGDVCCAPKTCIDKGNPANRGCK